MQTYWSILERVKGSALRLTRWDDEIYEHLKEAFPEFDPAETIDEDKMKSKEGKERWRNFMMKYDKKVGEFNFGTMLRSNPKFEYGREETIFGMRRCFTTPSFFLLFHLSFLVGVVLMFEQSPGCSSMLLRLRGIATA